MDANRMQPGAADDGAGLVFAPLTRSTWANLYATILDEAEELAEAGNVKALTILLGWTLPVLGAASADRELMEREEALRARFRVYLDDSARTLIEGATMLL